MSKLYSDSVREKVFDGDFHTKMEDSNFKETPRESLSMADMLDDWTIRQLIKMHNGVEK